MRWEVPDQAGRTVVVTGANSGIGAATARALAGAGARVVLACRDTGRGAAAAAAMPGLTDVRRLDLADLASVRAFAAGLDGPVAVLVNNAGVMAVPRARTADGFELQIGTNHLGHFALTGLLLDRITDRVVTVSSITHRLGRIRLDDLSGEHRPYRRWAAYAQSKLANVLFSAELQRRLAAAGSGVRSVAVHPGYVATNLQSHTLTFADQVMSLGNRLLAQPPEVGALPTLYAATAPGVPGGSYVGPAWPFGSGHPRPARPAAAARDPRTARLLWELSERLTGVRYPGPARSNGGG